MKKRLLSFAVVLMCVSILTGGTFAYFSTDEVTHNVITTSGVKINVLMLNKKNGSEDNDPIPVMPGITVSKVLAAQSVETEVWVRLNYEFEIYEEDGDIMPLSKKEVEKLILVEPDDENWIYKDGWWHYKKTVKSGEKTLPLFDEIKFAGHGMGNEYQNSTVKLFVKGQAVQKANNGKTVMEAAGWPEE